MSIKLSEHLPTDAWQEERANYIGGSEVAAILAESEYSTPLQVWMRKKGLLPPVEQSEVMYFGHIFEPTLAAYFESYSGLKTRKLSEPIVHKEHNFLRANIDRQVLASPENGLDSTAVLELKTTNSHRLKALDGEIPDEWYLQAQHYLALSSYEVGFLQIFVRDTCEFLDPLIIERDDELIIDMEEQLVQWWQKHMLEGIRPMPINGEDALILYPESNPEQVLEITPAGYDLYNELQQVRQRKADLLEIEEHLKTKLKDKLGKAERMVLGGKTLISWKSQSQNRLDTNAFKTAHPELYQQFVKQTSTRRFTVY